MLDKEKTLSMTTSIDQRLYYMQPGAVNPPLNGHLTTAILDISIKDRREAR